MNISIKNKKGETITWEIKNASNLLCGSIMLVVTLFISCGCANLIRFVDSFATLAAEMYFCSLFIVFALFSCWVFNDVKIERIKKEIK